MGKRENTSIVVNGFKDLKSDDEILQQLFEEGGVPFTDLRNVFNDIVKEKELRLSSKDRKIKTNEIMEGVTEIKDADELLSYVTKLQTKLKVASTKAMGSLRTWAKENSIELPKAPRIAKTRKSGFSGHYAKILGFIIEQRAAEKSYDKKEVVAFCHKANIPEAYSTVALNVVHFAKVWSGEVVEEAESEAESEEKAEA